MDAETRKGVGAVLELGKEKERFFHKSLFMSTFFLSVSESIVKILLVVNKLN